MLKSSLTKKAFLYMTPAVISLAAMSIMTKEIAVMKQNVWHNIIYYLVVSTFISGCYNLILFLFSRNKSIKLHRQLFSSAATHIGCYVITFSAALITAKTLALRIAPNPGYVVTLLLTAPLFVFMLSPQTPHREILSEKAGLAMLFFLCLIMLLTTSDIGIND